MNTPLQTVAPDDEEPDLQKLAKDLITRRLQTDVSGPEAENSSSANGCGQGPQWEMSRQQMLYELMCAVELPRFRGSSVKPLFS